MLTIIPSILTNNPDELRDLITQAEGKVERVHIDIIDGKFVDNKTIDPIALQEIDTELLIDYHLMVDEPINWVEKCAVSQADRIIAQIEKMSDQVEFVGKVTEKNLSVGLGVDLGTKVSNLDPVILNNLDVVLVMSVSAGFGGQEFDKSVLKKISWLDEVRARDDTPFRICDDGGLTLENISKVHYSQVEEVVIGRRLFKGDFEDNLKKFQKAAHSK